MPEPTPTWADFVAGWELGIYRDPSLCAILAGLALGVLGVFVVLRRAVFVTAVVSQSAGLGVSLAFLAHARWELEVPPALGGLVVALASVALLAFPGATTRKPKEGFLGFLFVAASAGALLVGDRIAAESHDIDAVLFGTAVLVRPEDLHWVALAALLSVGFVGACYRGLVFAGFDPDGARVQGLPVRALEVGFWAVVATAVSLVTRALGALPVFAFAVLPALTALGLAGRLLPAVVSAGLMGALAGFGGYLLAYFAAFPVGASQAAVAAALYALGALVKRSRG